MARLVALVACIAAGAASLASGSPGSHVTWFAGPTRLVSPSFGYAVMTWQWVKGDPSRGYGGGLYVFSGGRWHKASGIRRDLGIEDVAFPDARHGWLATFDPGRALVRVYRTEDGGANWHSLAIRAGHSPGGGPTYLSFPDASDGWLEPVSPNGPGGTLYRTTNGGSNWHLVGGLDAGEGSACLKRITAVSASVAFMPCQQLLRTTDGGGTWRPESLPLPTRWRTGAVAESGDPRFFGNDGVVAVSAWSHHGKAVLFYSTVDGGRKWSLRATRPASGFCQQSFPWPSGAEATVSIASTTTWWTMTNRFGTIAVTTDAGRHWQLHPSATLRRLGWCHVRSLTAGSGSFAWATTNERYRSVLYETRDGGRTWRAVSFPLR